MPDPSVRSLAQEVGVKPVVGSDALIGDNLGHAGTPNDTFVGVLRHDAPWLAANLCRAGLHVSPTAGRAYDKQGPEVRGCGAMRAKLSGLLVALVLLAGGVAGCGSDSDTEAASGGAKIVIGSLDSAESEVLARIYGDALKSAGATVEYRLRLGDAEVVVPALEEGRIDMVPAYLGDFLVAVDPSQTRGLSTAQALEALEGAAARRGLTLAEASSAAKSEVIAVTKDLAATQALKTISDLTKLPPPIVLAGPIDCAIRETCLVGLRATYGLDVALTATGTEDGGPLTKDALQEGRAQIGRLFSSDPETVSGGKYVVLEDDKVVQLPGNIVPVFRKAKTSPAILEVVNKVSEALTTEKLAELNEEIIEENAAPAAVAAGFAGTETH